jgi:NuA3 HAT complex component NTO1
MHPYCAANAGCMIGTDTNPTGIYCDKHLPFDRIPGAKRYISEQDLVAEMVTNDEEKKNGQYVRNKQTKYYKVQEDYSFLQESTCFLLEKERRLLGQQLLVPWIAKDNDEDDKGEEEMDYTTGEVKPKLFEKNDNLGSFLPTGIPVVPAMAVQRMHTQRLLTYPLPLPSSTNTCVQEFPSGKGLVGAIIDVYMNDIADWARARVVAYDPQRDANYVQLIHREQKGWTILSAKNTQVLYFPSDHEQEEEFDDILPLDRRITTRVKLFRPVHKGTQQWRPKPKLFRHKSRVSSSIAAVNVTPPQKGKQAK